MLSFTEKQRILHKNLLKWKQILQFITLQVFLPLQPLDAGGT